MYMNISIILKIARVMASLNDLPHLKHGDLQLHAIAVGVESTVLQRYVG